MSDGAEGRVRTPPRERFAPAEEMFDLAAVAEKLLAEPGSGRHGHRQMTLFRHGPATLALFCFEEADARFPDHVVDGVVIIQVLKGRLTVHTEQSAHEMQAGQVLRLGPNVRHDVVAAEPSQMLLTVCVEGPGSHAGGGEKA
ncbi:AraC family ligand binding domain-containing protein [Phycisphaerales bacterium AB-hyl4]|uniref:AraC family ligand binding domain-containing protein n=1 Tax=Natronomicrosphaera hydrolytica TaxID=3242702 RepID=A0ABV4U3L0_9BACT